MSANTLAILMNDEIAIDLSQFPFADGQYADGQEANEVADVNQTWHYIELGDNNTNVAQEQYLNTHPEVLEYTIL